MSITDIPHIVRRRYGAFATSGGRQESCCATAQKSHNFAVVHGLYSDAELARVPALSCNLARGCGNPTGFANLRPGEVVVDFGAGGGIDVILAAEQVGADGKVVGVDLAPEMVARGRDTGKPAASWAPGDDWPSPTWSSADPSRAMSGSVCALPGRAVCAA